MDANNAIRQKFGASAQESLTGTYDEYMLAMKRVRQRHSLRDSLPAEMLTPRERHRNKVGQKTELLEQKIMNSEATHEAHRVSVIASMVPDEIIYKHFDHTMRSYETALMFIDISGFTELCENCTKAAGRGGPSRLTQILNSYIGAMVQEILTHNGDVLKFSGDAFLSMWKKTPRLTMQDVVHTAIDCGLAIQKSYGTYVTDIGVMLKVKIAISAGISHFSIVGGSSSSQASYVIVGQPVWDVKTAEYLSTAGDVLTSASAWIYVNEAEYCTQPCGDGRHTKVLGVGATWKRVEKMHNSSVIDREGTPRLSDKLYESTIPEINFTEFSLRPAVVTAMRSTWWPGLRRFMLPPLLRAVDNDEPVDFLTEIRRVVVVFFNIITRTVTDAMLLGIVDTAYKCISSVTTNNGGLVNKVSMFDKDMMFLVVFGLRGLKHEDETQKALQCAFQCKKILNDEDIISVSIGVTSGTTYCGVVGHALRREYTVIGPAVNKAARLMMAYPDKVTCDKETFLRSKLNQEHFRLLESKPLKGIAKPGPIYEFNKIAFIDRCTNWRHPLLGRNEELRKYKAMLQNAIVQYEESFTRYKDHKFGVAIVGPKLVGKTRLLEEIINLTPSNISVDKIIVTEESKVPYGLFRQIATRTFKLKRTRNMRDICENVIRYSIDLMAATPTQIYAINTIFDCRFPLPEKFKYTADILDDFSVKDILREICKQNFKQFCIVAIEEAQFADPETWRIILLLLDWKFIFFVMTITPGNIPPQISKCLANHMIVKLKLTGIERWYHAAIACQLLDVQAIPPDLEKVIESASGGLPGWIQNFVISLVQRGALAVVTVPRSEAICSGAVMPSPALLQRQGGDIPPYHIEDQMKQQSSFMSIYSYILSTTGPSRNTIDSTVTVQDTDIIQMAVLAENYNFDDMAVDMAMDVVILKTYDALTPFEKMLLKCASVLGDVFSRRMLLHLLQSDSHRTVAQAVAKLFAIRVLECEGGDFTRDSSIVLIHPAPAMHGAKPPYCTCLGTRQPVNCRDLPMYAFCGYMKFRHTLFRTTTYDLLTESQKMEMHARALMFLERYTRRCVACGVGCFTRLLGVRCDEGLRDESDDLKRIRQQICALSAENKVPGEFEPISPFIQDSVLDFKCHKVEGQTSYELLDTEDMTVSVTNFKEKKGHTVKSKQKRVRSFSSLELDNCECLAILLSVYCQIIDHCRGADIPTGSGHTRVKPREAAKSLDIADLGEHEKLFEAYLEYADLSVINLNIPQAIRLLFEVETFLSTHKLSLGGFHKSWVVDYQLARIYSLRGVCMLESGDISEARNLQLAAMKLYCDPFPTSKRKIWFCNLKASIRQTLALYVFPNFYIGTEKGLVGTFYEHIAVSLNRMYPLFSETKDVESATLCAKEALSYALRSNADFRTTCISYGNMIFTYRLKRNFTMCSKLEKRALELCQRKRGNLDVTQISAVCYLYTNIFLFYVEYGKKMESLEFGLSVMHMMTNFIDLNTRQMLVIWMLKLLLSDLRIHDMVAIMREFFYMTDYYDLSAETWYYYYAIVILMDTGYSVETYATCERFYIKKGDAILRSKTPEAAWNFFVSMWLLTIRIGAWEKSLLWEDKVLKIMKIKFEKNEYSIMVLSRLVEGLLITLVKEMDNRNHKKLIVLEKSVKVLLDQMKRVYKNSTMYRPRYYLLLAYYNCIRGKKLSAFNYLSKASDKAKDVGHATITVWVDHTRNHWKGTLSPKYLDYWVQHTDVDKLLDYRDFDSEKTKIVPYTLPLPREH